MIIIKDTIKDLFFTNAIRFSRLLLWVGYFTYFRFTRVRDKFSKMRHIFVNHGVDKK